MTFDFKAHSQLVTTAIQVIAKATHKPSLNDKQSMEAYQKAMNATGKARFDVDAGSAIEFY